MSKIQTKIKQYSLGLAINNQKRNLIGRTPTKAQFVLHELISQIPLFWNYEKFIHAYYNQEEQKIIRESEWN